MRKIIAFCLMITMVTCFSSCRAKNSSVTVEEDGNIIKIIIDNFSGEEKIKIDHEGMGEGTLFCSVLITEGKLKAVSRGNSVFSRDQEFFDVDAKDGRKNDGVYVDANVKTVTLILAANEQTSGIVYLSFDRNVVNNLPYDCFVE